MPLRRRLSSWTFWAVCIIAAALIVAPSLSIIASVFRQALPLLGFGLLTHNTAHLGLENAILGTAIFLLGVLVIAGGIGICAGVYLAELAPKRLGGVLRFCSDVLAGIPSIVVGYVGYVALVVGFHWGYSLLAAVLALSVIVIPYVVKSTELSLRQVPSSLREGAVALGLEETPTTWRVIVPTAIPGIVSGIVVALAISTGETAPLLFTAGFLDKNPTFALFHRQVGYLTGITFTDTQLPSAGAHQLAAASAAVTLIVVIGLVLLGRALSARSRKANERLTL